MSNVKHQKDIEHELSRWARVLADERFDLLEKIALEMAKANAQFRGGNVRKRIPLRDLSWRRRDKVRKTDALTRVESARGPLQADGRRRYTNRPCPMNETRIPTCVNCARRRWEWERSSQTRGRTPN